MEVEKQQKTFDLRKFIFKLLSKWYLFVISIAIAYTFSYFYNKFEIPTYNVHTTLLISDPNRSAENVLGGLQLFRRSKNIQNEIGILRSYFLSEMVIEKLDFGVSYFEEGRFRDTELYKKAPFYVQFDSTAYQRNELPVYITFLSENKYQLEIKDAEPEVNQTLEIGQWYKGKHLSFALFWENSRSFQENMTGKTYFFIKKSKNGLTKYYSSKLNIEPLASNSSILWLWVIGTVPQKEADYLNTLVKTYIELGLKEKNQIAANTIKFIDERIKNIVDSLGKAEDNLQDYRTNNDIVNIDAESENLIEKLDEWQSNKISLEMKLRYYTYLLDDIQANNFSNLMSPTVLGIEDPQIVNLLTKMQELYNQRSVYSYKVNKDIPHIEKIDITINNTKELLVKSLKNNIEATNYVLNDINEKINRTTREIQKLPFTERQMLNIQRKFNMNDNIYTYLLQKRTEAGITQASNEPDAKVLDKARPENARWMSPNPGATRRKAIILALLIPFLLIVVYDFFNTKIVEKSDVEQITTIPIIGTISRNPRDSLVPVVDKPKSPIAESFRALRTNLQYLLIEHSDKIIAISSTIGGEGKTFCAVNLATVLAISQKKTLLLGLDLRKPKLHRYFDIDNQRGISTYLIDVDTFDDVILPSGMNNLWVAPAGPVPPNPAELIESKRMKLFIEEMKKRYDYIIIDTPPVAVVTDAVLVSKFSSVNLYIVRQNYTNKNMLKTINDVQAKQDLKNISIIINDVKMSKRYQGYGYGYEYGFGYSQGYYEEDEKNRPFFDKLKAFFSKK